MHLHRILISVRLTPVVLGKNYPCTRSSPNGDNAFAPSFKPCSLKPLFPSVHLSVFFYPFRYYINYLFNSVRWRSACTGESTEWNEGWPTGDLDLWPWNVNKCWRSWANCHWVHQSVQEAWICRYKDTTHARNSSTRCNFRKETNGMQSWQLITIKCESNVIKTIGNFMFIEHFCRCQCTNKH